MLATFQANRLEKLCISLHIIPLDPNECESNRIRINITGLFDPKVFRTNFLVRLICFNSIVITHLVDSSCKNRQSWFMCIYIYLSLSLKFGGQLEEGPAGGLRQVTLYTIHILDQRCGSGTFWYGSGLDPNSRIRLVKKRIWIRPKIEKNTNFFQPFFSSDYPKNFLLLYNIENMNSEK